MEALTVVVASDDAAPVHPIPVPILLVLSSQQILSAHAKPVVSGLQQVVGKIIDAAAARS